ncbi:MAG: glycosyltransferase family 4 protein [Nitrospirota bacterium]
MKIIYDISVLGTAFYLQTARTGISRVIENVAVELVRDGCCDIGLCAYFDLLHLVQAGKYLRSMPDLGKVRMISSSDDRLNRFIRTIGALYPNPSRHVISRAVRRGYAYTLNPFTSRYESIERDALQQADVFHATFYPIPQFVRSYPRLSKFITIYDLIPILHREFFSFKADHLLHDVMKSITADDWVIAISQHTKNDLCEYLKFDPDRVFVTHLAASALFHPCENREVIQRARAKYGIPEGPYILSLSTLEPRKNIDHTIRSFVRLVREQGIRDLNLVLIGTKGWDFDTINKELVSNDRIGNRISVTGYVADEDLAALYSGARMFVYPSFYEGFGLPPLEAMQCGIPVITSNTSSLPEVVGDAGIMVDPRDEDALCQNMLNIYRDSVLHADLAERSLARAKQFSWKRCARDTIAAYRVARESVMRSGIRS